MDDFTFLQEFQGYQDLSRILANLRYREAKIVSVLNMLKQILVQELKHEHLVVLPAQVLLHSDDVVLVIWVFSHQLPQESGLSICELVVDLRVPVDLDRDFSLPVFVVDCRHHLCEAAFAEQPCHLEPVK